MTLAVHVGFIVMITFTEWNNDYTISIFKFWSTKKNFKSGQILLFHFPAGKDFFHKCASINAKCYDMGNIGYALYNTCYAPKPHETSWNISCTFPAISQRTENGKIMYFHMDLCHHLHLRRTYYVFHYFFLHHPSAWLFQWIKK